MTNKKTFAEVHPELLEEWNWQRNKGIINPYEVSPASLQEAWWQCRKCGYEWKTKICNRHAGRGCLYCAKNVVWSGHNDLATLYPELISEWDYQKNTEINPSQMSISSKKKVWWICHACGYQWIAEIGSRASGGNGCPYCRGRTVWVGHNDLGTTNPELASEWDYKKNIPLLPTMVTAGSRKKAWWICSVCGYHWEATIGSRKQGNGCPKCSKVHAANNHRVSALRNGNNTLATINPLLAKEWDKSKNTLSPEEVTANTNRKVWWICPTCGYSYQAAIANRHKNGSGCPVCANQILCPGKNDLQTIFPEIAAEWSEKNITTPDKVLAGGHTKYYFTCSHCGYTWKAQIVARIRGTGCPRCSFSLHTSVPEQVIYQCLKMSIPSVLNSYKPQWLGGREIDIYIPTVNVGIEYDGAGWHMNIKKDIDKTLLLNEHGITLIRIREPKCPQMSDNSIQIITEDPQKGLWYLEKAVNELFDLLNNRFKTEITLKCDIHDIYVNELKKHRDKKLDDSFAINHPELLDEWEKDKNKGIDPYNIPPRSRINIWWKCRICGYEWQATPYRRSSGAGCPYCSHEVVWIGHNDVATIRPDLLNEWDYENNTIRPQEVAPNSHKQIAWKCEECGYQWKSPLYNKSAGHGCPRCAREMAADKQSKRVKNLDTGEIYKSAREAAETANINHSCITRVCRGEGKKAGGFHWAYIED